MRLFQGHTLLLAKRPYKHHGFDKFLLDEDIDYSKLADITKGYSGSDIANVCKDAVMAPIRELDQTDLIKDTSVKARPVRHQDYMDALENVNKSVSTKELTRFERWDEEFGAG